MTLDEAIQRLQQLKAESGRGDLFLEVKQLNGMNRTVNSMRLEDHHLPDHHCVLILLNDEPVHG